MAQSNSEEDINTPALLHLPPQINSLFSLFSSLGLSVCRVCVCFRYLSQFGMRALQLHADQTRWRDKEGGWEERPVETKRESSWRVLALNWIVFLVSSIRSSRPNPPLSRPAFLCVFIYIYKPVCGRDCYHTLNNYHCQAGHY